MGTTTMTIVDTFFEQVQKFGDSPALRRRVGQGEWQAISWRQYGAEVNRVSWGMLALGVKPGDKIGILSSNRPEWLYTDIGSLAIGTATVPIYPTLIATQVEHVVSHSEMTVCVVENNQQRDKLREIRANCPALKTVVIMNGDAGANEITWADFLAQGDVYKQRNSEALPLARETIEPGKLATIVYTSGTTGPSKGAMLSHNNLMFEVRQMIKLVEIGSHEETLSFLPLSHIAERLQGELMAITAGLVVNFARSIDTVKEDLTEVRPTVLTCVPRLWEKMHEGIMAQLTKAPPRRAQLFHWAVGVGVKRYERRLAGKPVGLLLELQCHLADRLVASKVRAKLGLDRARFLISGAAPLSPVIQRFFVGLGLPILEAYGQTECAGVSHGTPPFAPIRMGRVGVTLPGIECKIAGDGEILLRGQNVFMGYYKDEAATREAVIDGWLHTGDIGEMDAQGYLKITDRKKDIIVTAGGKNVAPQNIENRLKSFTGISQVVVLGDKRKFLVALVTIDAVTMPQVIGRTIKGKPSQDSAVRDYIQKALDAVNAELSSYERLKCFDVLDNDFSIEGGELTPTLKVKRRVIDQRYRDAIDSMYAAA